MKSLADALFNPTRLLAERMYLFRRMLKLETEAQRLDPDQVCVSADELDALAVDIGKAIVHAKHPGAFLREFYSEWAALQRVEPNIPITLNERRKQIVREQYRRLMSQTKKRPTSHEFQAYLLKVARSKKSDPALAAFYKELAATFGDNGQGVACYAEPWGITFASRHGNRRK